MTHITSKQIASSLMERLKIGYNNLIECESGLVVCWFDIVKVLVLLCFAFVCLSPIIDATYLHVVNAANGTYSTTDVEFVGDIYDLWRFIPLVGVGLVIFYAINYSNWKRNE